jgi:two-component system, response regulator PdtaR
LSARNFADPTTPHRSRHGTMARRVNDSTPGRSEPMNPLCVLVVEDDGLVGMLLAQVLVGMGCEICAIEATEAGAVATALRCKPDLMIVDVRLGDGSGLSAVDQIHLSAAIPYVLISGDIRNLRTQRPDAVILQKPFRDADLSRAIRRALGALSTP